MPGATHPRPDVVRTSVSKFGVAPLTFPGKSCPVGKPPSVLVLPAIMLERSVGLRTLLIMIGRCLLGLVGPR